jgi:hypothetical protein
MKAAFALAVLVVASRAFAASVRVNVNIMPRVVFTGDSQICGRTGAWDYPQMLSWEMPIRVLNTGVGGTSTRHLLSETTGGTAEVSAGEKEIRGTSVSWHAGPYPGQRMRLGPHEYTIDRIVTTSYKESLASIWLTEPAKESFSGTDYAIEAGWRVRVADRKPDYACFLYSVNDTGWESEQFIAQLEDIVQRTRELGAQPVFLSGVPLMDTAKGGSHPGHNKRVEARANDLASFCRDRDIPYGDVFHALMLLDEHATSVWVDTVHPTTDGSTAMLNALRRIFRELGVTDNPYYVRGYRTASGLAEPDDAAALTPFTTSQPDYSAANVQNENEFDLAAIEVRDEYGLIAEADGDAVASETPLLLEFGVGECEAVSAAEVEVVARPAASVSWFDWRAKQWRPLAEGEGDIRAAMSADRIARAWHKGTIWLAVEAEGGFALDYAALILAGEVAPYQPRRSAGSILWPRPGELTWEDDADNLIRNGGLAKADGGLPRHWQNQGPQAEYVRRGIVAEGIGDFVQDKRIDLFRAPAQDFTRTVRPLDVLVIAEGPEHATGRFLISRVLDDETLRVRRRLEEVVGDLAFQIHRSSGCLAVPGGCAVQCRGDSCWETTVPGLEAGLYRLGFFHRTYDPENMKAKIRPGRVAKVEVRLGAQPAQPALATADELAASYQWQRAWLDLRMTAEADIHVRLGALTDTAVEYTGLTLHRQEGD